MSGAPYISPKDSVMMMMSLVGFRDPYLVIFDIHWFIHGFLMLIPENEHSCHVKTLAGSDKINWTICFCEIHVSYKDDSEHNYVKYND